MNLKLPARSVEWERIEREGGKSRQLLVLQFEAEVLRVEIDRPTDVRDLRFSMRGNIRPVRAY